MAWEYGADNAKKDLTPLKAIRAKCLDCCCGQWYEVKMCTIDWCPLYEYRDGHNPKRKGISGAQNTRHRSITENKTIEPTEHAEEG